jgi:hypothetical protein
VPFIPAYPMSGLRLQFVFAVLVLLCSIDPAFGTQRRVRPKSPAKQDVPAPEALAAPPSPLTLAQMPASPPQVTYSNGALTIVAENSTIGDILRAVHAKTGTVMDISGNPTERVVSRFGPGSPREVLAQLLNGSDFNYVILGSAVDAGTVQRVVLSPKSSGAEPEAEAQAPAAAGEPNSFPRVQSPPGQASQDMSDDESDESDTADEPAATPPAGSESQPNQPAVKTPEQLLRELQRQQQLQQQQPPQGGAETPQATPRQQ